MRRRLSCIAVLLLTLGATAGFAQVEQRQLRTLALPAAALDVATSADGQRTFVLLADGAVQLYDPSGSLLGRFTVDKGARAIAPSPDGNQVYVSVGEELRLIAVDFVHQLDLTDVPSRGPAAAPVTLAVFSDFQCPYCARLVPLLEQVLARYPTQVKLVFKNFPLRNHDQARPAALAALAAGEQGKFWEVHDLLFRNYSSLNEAKFTELAQQAGLDPARFAADRARPELAARVDRDLREGARVGVRGTPSLYLNGRQLRLSNLAGLQAEIDAELAK